MAGARFGTFSNIEGGEGLGIELVEDVFDA